MQQDYSSKDKKPKYSLYNLVSFLYVCWCTSARGFECIDPKQWLGAGSSGSSNYHARIGTVTSNNNSQQIRSDDWVRAHASNGIKAALTDNQTTPLQLLLHQLRNPRVCRHAFGLLVSGAYPQVGNWKRLANVPPDPHATPRLSRGHGARTHILFPALSSWKDPAGFSS
jgi:hypothetical protein